MPEPLISNATRAEPDRPRLTFPPAVGPEGRLICVTSEPAAVRQLLGLVRDVARGEFPGMPSLYNPCDYCQGDTEGEQIMDLCVHLRQFFAGLGLEGIGVTWERPGTGEEGLGRIVMRGPGEPAGWSLSLRVERREGSIVWDARDLDEDGRI